MATLGLVRRIEGGPYGATPLISGEEKIGEIISAPFPQSGDPCGAVRLSDASLAQTAFALSAGKLSLPGHASNIGINMTSRDHDPAALSTRQHQARQPRIQRYGAITPRMKP